MYYVRSKMIAKKCIQRYEDFCNHFGTEGVTGFMFKKNFQVYNIIILKIYSKGTR